ncbi:dipeptidyl-peptidase-4 [Nonomuraea polychroma]|uniref:Dipeptidyl-peptidase-4 n=1 Tax=Nonomuraea polychroma TaxID=46176 RepID=A0A438M7W8_9ACTN|nr:prolyl oligopeptidase family serine peptidase [Nonomuraea polychroma]RVX41705.1 dipeptidyl-peptidase-4 [Nonomuraea polychroma]
MIGMPGNGPAPRSVGADGLPRQFARTRRFSLGDPSAFTVSADGASVVFLRSRGGDDPVACLWALDLDSGAERLLADPVDLLGGTATAGISAYATDDAAGVAAFALAGRLWVVDVAKGGVRELPATGDVRDPRPDPAGRRIAYVSGGALRVTEIDGSEQRVIAEPDGPEVRFGVAEHAAAESMGRTRGHWWSPDGDRLLVARVDESAVALWHVADPSDPARPPRAVRYPAAGTANAEVTLWIAGLDGTRTEVRWDRAAFEYVTAAGWDAHGPYLAVQSRDQRTVRVLAADPDSGRSGLLAEQRDAHWVQLVGGTPARTAAGALVAHADVDGTRRLTLDGVPVTPPGLHLREVLSVAGDDILFSASTDPAERHLWLQGAGDRPRRVSIEPGVHAGVWRAGTLVHVARTSTRPGATTTAVRSGRPAVTITSLAERPVLTLRAIALTTTDRELRSHLLLPSWHRPGDPKLPVLVDPYAGPALQRVTADQAPMTFVSQWFAEQGFAVLITDGRGTPGRGPAWEREVHGDIFGPPLDDQVAALHAVAARHPDLDLSRVAIRGWSFSGTLAVMAVLRRPDVFHAAVAGAGTSDQRLYDTHWRERFLGHPNRHPDRYEACSTLPEAPRLTRPLLLIHGLADDNVFAAGTLRLSAALLAAGRPHEVLPLSGTAHSPTSDPDVFEGLLLHQLGFLRWHLQA